MFRIRLENSKRWENWKEVTRNVLAWVFPVYSELKLGLSLFLYGG